MNLKKIISVIIKILNVIFVWITIALFLIVIFKREWFELFFEWLKLYVEWLWDWNYLIILLISIIESFPVLWVVVPGQQAMLIVWWVAWNISLMPIIVCAWIWTLLWNYIWFLLGSLYWKDFFRKYWNWFWVWETEMKYIRNSVIKNWSWFVIFWKFHNTTRAFIPFIVWSMKMDKRKFWIYNFIGSVIWSTVIILLWTVFVEHYKTVLDYIGYIFTAIFVWVWVYIYFFKKEGFKQYLKDKEAELNGILR